MDIPRSLVALLSEGAKVAVALSLWNAGVVNEERKSECWRRCWTRKRKCELRINYGEGGGRTSKE